MTLLAVGSMALDDLELPGGSFPDVLGGSVTHLSFVASALTACRIVAVVGDDFPSHVLDRLGERGVDVTGVQRKPGKTFRWAGRYPAGFAGRETIGTWLGVFETFDPVLPEPFRDSETVFLANIAPSLQARVLDQVRSPRFVAIDTMNYWIRGARDALESVVRRVDGIFVNDEEVLEWTGAPDVFDGIDALHAKGPRVVVVKRGEHGAYLSDRGDLAFVPAVPVRRVVDPTGAGDAFAGGFMGHVDRAGSCDAAVLRDALRTAAAAGSFAVEEVGADALARVGREGIDSRRAILAALVA